MVMLYTDGEDDDQVAILEQEAKLDNLFADRSRRGLQQTVVFCKRWQGANAKLVAAIREDGHAQVIDAGELCLLPVALVPELKLTTSEWDLDNPRALAVSLSASVALRGDPNVAGMLGNLRLTCLYPDASGDVAVELVPGQKPKSLDLRLPLTESETLSGRVEIEFDVAGPVPHGRRMGSY